MSSEGTRLLDLAESFRLVIKIFGELHGLRDPEQIALTIACAVMLVSESSPPDGLAENMANTCRILREMCDLELAEPGSVAPMRAPGVTH